MIIAVTINPAIDKTIDVGKLKVGGMNRIQRIELDIGGKGINVAKTIQSLGGDCIVTGFLAGKAGNIINNTLNTMGIKSDFICVDGETRTNTKVVDNTGLVTELNEAGPDITEEQINQLLNKLETYAKEDVLFVLAGSVPTSVPKDIYATMIKMIHKRGGKVLLDADGELFKHAIEAVPDMIKPNREELLEYAGIKEEISEKKMLEIADDFISEGIEMIAISLGKSGALFINRENKMRCSGLKVKTHSTVGAGDAMVAVIAYGWDQKLEFNEVITLSMATSAGAVTTIGTNPPSMEIIGKLREQVTIEKIVKQDN